MIFAAACDFSKSSRDACRNWCRERGLQEVHVWGKAEIEDQLYQPKNDHLLFAYFGISLQIRRQSLTSQLRRTTTLKRKIKRHLDDSGWLGQVCLIRDPSDESFPHADGKSLLDGGFLWRPYYVKGVGTHGLRVVLRCHHGYLDTTTGEWDIATALDRSIPHEVNEYWPSREPRVERGAGVIERWTTLPRATNIS